MNRIDRIGEGKKKMRKIIFAMLLIAGLMMAAQAFAANWGWMGLGTKMSRSGGGAPVAGSYIMFGTDKLTFGANYLTF